MSESAAPSPGALLRHRAGVAAQPYEGGLMLMVPGLDTVHILNASAAAVWAALSSPASVDEVALRVAQGYGLPLDTVHEGVRSAVDGLVAAALVQHCG